MNPPNSRRLLHLLITCVLLWTDIRDIAKNSLLRWPVFMYWTCLGVFDAVIFFFGAYFLFDNTTFTSNGQVSQWESWDFTQRQISSDLVPVFDVSFWIFN